MSTSTQSLSRNSHLCSRSLSPSRPLSICLLCLLGSNIFSQRKVKTSSVLSFVVAKVFHFSNNMKLIHTQTQSYSISPATASTHNFARKISKQEE